MVMEEGPSSPHDESQASKTRRSSLWWGASRLKKERLAHEEERLAHEEERLGHDEERLPKERLGHDEDSF